MTTSGAISVTLTGITVCFVLVWGAYGAALAYYVPISSGTEPEWLARINLLAARATAIPEDVTRAVGSAVFGIAVVALAKGGAVGTWWKVAFVVGLIASIILATVGLLFLSPTDELAQDVIGGKDTLTIVFGMARKSMELGLTLLGAALGLKLL